MKNERWKSLINFKDVEDMIYEVSDHGNVRYSISKNSIHKKIANKKNHPYYAVYLQKKDKKSEWVLVHQLVAYCFVNIPKRYTGQDDLVPDHLDNDGLNNYYKNLEWKTRGENVSSAFEKGFINNSCDNNKNSIVTNIEVEKICELLQEKLSYDTILDIMKFPHTKQYRRLLVRIKNKLAWTEISNRYNFNSKTPSLNKNQQENFNKIPEIINLIRDKKSPSEICSIVFPNTTKRDAKMIFIKSIISKSVYKDYLSKFDF